MLPGIYVDAEHLCAVAAGTRAVAVHCKIQLVGRVPVFRAQNAGAHYKHLALVITRAAVPDAVSLRQELRRMVFLALRADLFDLLLQALDEHLPGFCIFRCAFYSAEPGKAQLVAHFHVPHIERKRRILLHRKEYFPVTKMHAVRHLVPVHDVFFLFHFPLPLEKGKAAGIAQPLVLWFYFRVAGQRIQPPVPFFKFFRKVQTPRIPLRLLPRQPHKPAPSAAAHDEPPLYKADAAQRPVVRLFCIPSVHGGDHRIVKGERCGILFRLQNRRKGCECILYVRLIGRIPRLYDQNFQIRFTSSFINFSTSVMCFYFGRFNAP